MAEDGDACGVTVIVRWSQLLHPNAVTAKSVMMPPNHARRFAPGQNGVHDKIACSITPPFLEFWWDLDGLSLCVLRAPQIGVNRAVPDWRLTMALGPLADFVAFIDAQPFSSGLGNRKKFNEDPVGTLSKFNVTGDDLGAFLTFEKGTVGLQVLQDLKDGDPSLSNADDVQDFGSWLYDFVRWEFDLGEEKEYGGVFPNSAIGTGKIEYGNPLCQIRGVDVTKTAPGTGGKMQVSLDVYGEGFLKNKTTVNIYTAPKNAGDKPLDSQDVDPTKDSTFRGGRLQLQANLASGNYQVGVDIDLGNGSAFAIDTPVDATKFSVP